MDFDFGTMTVVAITVICYLVGLVVKAIPLDNKWIPCIVGIVGAILGVVGLYVGIPDFPAVDPITAAAIGAASGLAATGANQVVKQLTATNEEDYR